MKFIMRSYPSLFTNGRLNSQAKYFLSNGRPHSYREYTVVDDSDLSDERKWQLDVAGVKVKKLGVKMIYQNIVNLVLIYLILGNNNEISRYKSVFTYFFIKY